MVGDLNELLDGLELPAPENELVTMSEKLPLWQRDALRRIAQHGELTDADVDELKSAMYADHDLDVFEGELTPLSADHCQANPDSAPLAMLCSIGPVEHINRLASENEPLQFAPQGITLNYGDNGSGKSGYIRISKKVCRGRSDEELLGDAYAEKQGEPKATIRWQVEGNNTTHKVDWNPNDPPPEALSAISIFDTKHANLYVDSKRQMAYLPFEVDLYRQLGKLVTAFGEEVGNEVEIAQGAIVALPPITPDTTAANLVDAVMQAESLDDLPTELEIEKFTTWTDEDEKRLTEARVQAAQNPQTQADVRVRCIAALENLAERAEAIETVLTAQKAKELEQKSKELQAAKVANDLAIKGDFSDMPELLDGVGTEVWKSLYGFAREYAAVAYPGQDFPYTGVDAKCVLCQQPLDDAAKERFLRFDHFVSGKSAQEYQTKSAEMRETLQALTNLDIPNTKEANAVLAAYANLGDVQAKHAEAFLAFLGEIEKRRDAFIVAATMLKFEGIGEPVEHAATLREHIKTLKSEEAQFRKDAQDDSSLKQQALELAELEGRKSLAENRANLLSNLANRAKLLKLTACAGGLSTQGISLKINKLRDKHLTSELNAKIQAEIHGLGLDYLNVSVKDKTTKGESNFLSDLGFRQPVKGNSYVLSEGEQRGLALACYLAEADLRPKKHGLIIDDPVSSLDHQRIELVAKRLVEEAAKGRQVIIFTHNILFYMEVERLAAKLDVGLARNTIHRHQEHGAGIVEADKKPHSAQKVTDRIQAIRAELAAMAAAGVGPQEAHYRNAVEFVCKELRKIWERLVEEVLLNRSVERFSYGVKTLSLKGVVVTDDDYKKIYFAMEQLSSFTAHDEAAGKQGALPTVDDLKAAVDDLDNYRVEIKKRSTDVGKIREALQGAPKAEFV